MTSLPFARRVTPLLVGVLALAGAFGAGVFEARSIDASSRVAAEVQAAPPATQPVPATQAQPPQGQGLAGQRGRGGRGGRAPSVPVNEQGECPPGMTEWRAGQCRAPEFPPPSIVDYRPRSTLVVEEHPVPRAKFPVIDAHNHTGITAGNIDQMIRDMDALNLRVLIHLTPGSDPADVKARVDFIRSSAHPDRFRVFANVDWRNADAPGWAAKATADLEQSVRNGAIGLKIAKNLGLSTVKTDGSRLHVDDPILKPIWDLCARLDIPVIIHTAEPQEFFSPLDMHNERWLELALFEDRRNYMPGRPTFEELMGERDRMYAANPKTRYIGAHFNWYANDLGRAAKQLDERPNLVLETGAILYDLGRQPRAARRFFEKYQDRILFGKDAFAASEFPYYWRVFETEDEYFDYYRDYHAFWKLYGLGLPDEILKKVYYKNALRWIKGLPQSGWPQ
jgi:predicted TIM-barrel fold metal-dependent hydrolase